MDNENWYNLLDRNRLARPRGIAFDLSIQLFPVREKLAHLGRGKQPKSFLSAKPFGIEDNRN